MHRCLAFIAALAVATMARPAAGGAVARLTIDASEARQVLRILDKLERNVPVREADWRALFATEPYRWLEEREAALGAAFDDGQFEAFVRSDEARKHRSDWARALAQLEKTDPRTLGARVLEWLPEGARIRARVFPEIKPHRNSFVWARDGEEPAIFMALDRQTRNQFENTMAHECHHIGLHSLEPRQESARAGLSPRATVTLRWMMAFGEGEAMLAAAGTAQRHPHWQDDALVRARWDGDLMHFNADVERLEQFLADILEGRIAGEQDIRKRAAPFWGDAQGAWYTVGYEMSVLVEQRFGRRAFLDCLIDPRNLLTLYNQVAEESAAKGATLRRWSPQLLTLLSAH